METAIFTGLYTGIMFFLFKPRTEHPLEVQPTFDRTLTLKPLAVGPEITTNKILRSICGTQCRNYTANLEP